VREFLALLLRGRMGKDRSVIVEGEVSIEPPDKIAAAQMVCVSLSGVEICIPAGRGALTALKAEIERALKSAK
jgi:hypothetical protein